MTDSRQTQDYYEGTVEPIYRAISGGTLHLAMFERAGESREAATTRTKEYLTGQLDVPAATTLIDLGSGYGDTARFLSRHYGCRVVGINLVHSQNRFALAQSRAVGLQDQISIAEADFRSVPLRDGCAQVVWSQESLLHAPDRGQVLQEAARLLQADGALLFTDILQTGPMAQDEAQGIYERVKIDSLESFESYTDLLRQTGFTLEQQVDLSRYMADSYADHIDKIEAHRAELVAQIGPDYVDYTVEAMGRWVAAAQAGKIGWGMFVARRAEA